VSTAMQICQLRIRTSRGWQDPYKMDKPVVAIVGPVDTGKSSFLDCVAFALGRDVEEFRGAVNRELREVEILVRFASGTYMLRRSRRTSSHVEILDAVGTLEQRLPIRMREGGPQTISDWLLQQLGLIDTLASVRLPGDKTLDFSSALLPYCYLTQNDIDRHIIRPPRDDAARLVVLKLLLNLTTPEAERLAGQIRDADNEIVRRTRQASLIGEFFAESPTMHPGALSDELERLRTSEAAAASWLQSLKDDARAASPSADPDRQRVFEARGDVAEYELELDKVQKLHDHETNNMMSIREALAALVALEERSPDDRVSLRLTYPQCPACESETTDRRVPPGHCHLCCQPLAGAVHSAERRRLSAAHQQSTARLLALDSELRTAADQADAARGELANLLKKLDIQARDGVMPYVDRIATAAANLAEIQGRIATLGRLHETHDRLREQYDQIDELELKQAERRQRVVGNAGLEAAEEVLGRLNTIFRRVVQGIDLPHATGRARIDPDTLLPLVDEQTFGQRGGGARAAVSVAYSLTLLTYALENNLANLPALLIIDSPQKNFGANKDDKALAQRVYARFLDYMAERVGWSQQFRRPFQLIIVDNDLHAGIKKRIDIIEFTHDRGFVRELADPHGNPGELRQLDFGDLEIGAE